LAYADTLLGPITSSTMAVHLPARLIGYNDGKFEVFDPRDPAHRVDHFDIITYTWGDAVPLHESGIDGVTWNVPINQKKIEDIKRLMVKANVQYLWADCVCINQEDPKEKAVEIPKMYQYYKSARKCYILMDSKSDFILQSGICFEERALSAKMLQSRSVESNIPQLD
jgi:hypothetical protein